MPVVPPVHVNGPVPVGSWSYKRGPVSVSGAACHAQSLGLCGEPLPHLQLGQGEPGGERLVALQQGQQLGLQRRLLALKLAHARMNCSHLHLIQ